MIKEEAQKLMGTHRDVGKFVMHIAERINDREQEHYSEVAQARIGGDNEISGDYEAGVRKGTRNCTYGCISGPRGNR